MLPRHTSTRAEDRNLRRATSQTITYSILPPPCRLRTKVHQLSSIAIPSRNGSNSLSR
jgi:hypothetical protein